MLRKLRSSWFWIKFVNSSFWFRIYYKHRRDFKEACKAIKEEHRSFAEGVLRKMRKRNLLEAIESRIPVDLLFIDGKLYLPVQSDVENIALETMDDARRIYFDPIPLIDNLYLKYDRESNYGWEVLVK